MADNTFMLEIVTPEQIVFKDEVQFVVVPAVDGELGVLVNHAALVTALTIGVLRYREPSGAEKKMAVSGGLMEVVDNVARVLAETSERGSEIDILRAKDSARRARERLTQRNENINYARAQLSLNRAIARLKAAGEKLD